MNEAIRKVAAAGHTRAVRLASELATVAREPNLTDDQRARLSTARTELQALATVLECLSRRRGRISTR